MFSCLHGKHPSDRAISPVIAASFLCVVMGRDFDAVRKVLPD